MLRKTLSLLAAAALLHTAPAARAGEPTWTATFQKAINWNKLTPAGVLVVSCKDALYGIDPESGKQKWRIEEFNNIQEENFDPIMGSPFVAVTDKVGGKGAGKLGVKIVVLDVFTGATIADTKALGLMNAQKRAYEPALGVILFYGTDESGAGALVAADAVSGTEKWRTTIDKKSKETAVSLPYVVDDNKAFVWATNTALYKLDAASGKVLWRTESKTTDDAAAAGAAVVAGDKGKEESDASKVLGLGGMTKSVNSMGSTFGAFSGKSALDAGATTRTTYSSLNYLEAPQSPGRVFVFSNDYLTAFDLKTGKEIWEREPLKSPISNIIYDDRGLIVATSEFDDDPRNNGKARGGLSRVNLYRYTDGERMWGKSGVETDGTVGAYSFSGNNFVVATYRASGRNRLDIIDLDKGDSKLRRPMKVDGSIRRVMLVPDGLLYITDREMNVMNLETGKDDWAKSVKFDKEKGVVTMMKEDQCYILSDDKMWALDCKTADYKTFAEKISFKGKEYPTDFEIVDEGIVLKSAQNMQLRDWSGKEVYSYYTPAPGRSIGGKIFFGTMGVLNAAAGAAAAGAAASEGYRAGASGYGSSAYNDHMHMADVHSQNAGALMGAAAGSFQEMSKRFKATKDGKNMITILTKIKDDEESGVGIKMIDKRSGNEVANLVLDSKKPDYILDDIGRMVYFKAESNEIRGYKF